MISAGRRLGRISTLAHGQQAPRIDRLAADPQLEMQVGPGGEARRPHSTDRLAACDGVAFDDREPRQVRLGAHDTVMVVDEHEPAEAAVPVSEQDMTGLDRMDPLPR